MVQDRRVLEEIIELKSKALKTKDTLFSNLTTELGTELGIIECMLEEESFFPAEILKKVRNLKQLIKVAQ